MTTFSTSEYTIFYPTAMRFAPQGEAYSATRIAYYGPAKVGRDVRFSKLISFANKI